MAAKIVPIVLTGPIRVIPAGNYCIQCFYSRNQYGQQYTVPTDEAYCLIVFDQVIMEPSRCADARKPGVSATRCGERGALFRARPVA